MSEREVLELISEGYSSKEIAHKMKISENSILFYRKSLFFKFGAKNVAHLVKQAIKLGLLHS